MKSNYEIKKWISSVIKSSLTWEQLTTCEKLVKNFKHQMVKNGYDEMLMLPYIIDLEVRKNRIPKDTPIKLHNL
jgi:hypothetical protein